MIVQISTHIHTQGDFSTLNNAIIKAIERNFGGIDINEVVTYFA